MKHLKTHNQLNSRFKATIYWDSGKFADSTNLQNSTRIGLINTIKTTIKDKKVSSIVIEDVAKFTKEFYTQEEFYGKYA